MKKNVYVVVGQYKLKPDKYSSSLAQIVDQLRETGEVNVFDLPCASNKDSVEKDQSLFVHHYTCTDDIPAEQRIKEMIRDIVVLNPQVCYIDYGIGEDNIRIVESICSAMKKYGIKIQIINKRLLFRNIRILLSDIRFWCREVKLRRKENVEFQRIEEEAYSGLGHPMAGFGYYQTIKRNRAERKRLHEEEKRAPR